MLRPFQIIICSLQNSPLKLFAHITSLQSDQDSWGNLKAMGRMRFFVHCYLSCVSGTVLLLL
jgi:hypothetical protein